MRATLTSCAAAAAAATTAAAMASCPVHAATMWPPAELVATPAAYPKVLAAGHGDFAIAYGDPTGGLSAAFGPPTWGVKYQSLRRPADTGAPASLPQLAADRAGDAVVAAVDGPSGSVLAATRRAHARFDPLRRLTANTALSTVLALRVAVGPGGRAAVAWTNDITDRRAGIRQGLMVATGRPQGNFGRPRVVAGGAVADGDVAVGARGVTYAAWTRGGRVAVRTISPAGRLSRQLWVSSATTRSESPRIAASEDGHALVVWRESRPGASVIAEADLGAGGVLGRRRVISRSAPGARDASEPVVRESLGGAAIVAYIAYPGPDSALGPMGDQGGRLYLVSRPRARGFGAPTALTGPGSHVLDPSLSLAASGYWLAAFNQGDPGTDVGGEEFRRAVVAWGIQSGSRVWGPEVVSGREDVNFNGAVDTAVADDGQAVVAWGADDPANPFSDVYATDRAGLPELGNGPGYP